jgi:hypothetical protein
MRNNFEQPSEFPSAPEPENESGRGERDERALKSRRDFLRLSGGIAALFAVEGCASKLAGAEKIMRMAELIDRREPFMKRWRVALEEGLAEFEGNEKSRAAFGEATSKELVEAIRSFDIEEYIATLAREGNVRPEEIGGEILSFRIVPEGAKGTMAAVTELRHMNIYGGEWMKYKGGVHKPTVHAVVRHELAHIFSFDYGAPIEASVPFIYEPPKLGWTEKARLGESLYEGLTELVARTASEEAGGEQSVEQGYRGGATLSAYVLGELLGRRELIHAYLKHDTRELKRLFDDKIGKDSHLNLTDLVNPGAVIFNENYDESLDFLYQAFRLKEIGSDKMNRIIEKARQEGIHERAAFSETNGIAMTTHLYKISDADEPTRYALNALAVPPDVYRFNKVTDPDGFMVSEHFNLKIYGAFMSEGSRDQMVEAAATSLKKHCELKNPREYALANAYAMIGYDRFIDERLMLLNGFEENNSHFEKIWKEINTHAIELVAETVRKIYDQAGVTDLVVEKGRSKSK